MANPVPDEIGGPDCLNRDFAVYCVQGRALLKEEVYRYQKEYYGRQSSGYE
jgi:hypothetical protein